MTTAWFYHVCNHVFYKNGKIPEKDGEVIYTAYLRDDFTVKVNAKRIIIWNGRKLEPKPIWPGDEPDIDKKISEFAAILEADFKKRRDDLFKTIEESNRENNNVAI